MPDEQTQPEAQPAPTPAPEPQPSEDDKMTAAGFRKVRGRWVR